MELGIDSARAGKTIREVLQQELGYSSNLIKKLKFSEGGILVNGEFRTVRYVLAEGDRLALRVEDSAADVSPYTIPAELPIDVVFEDSNGEIDEIFEDDLPYDLNQETIALDNTGYGIWYLDSLPSSSD